LFAVKKIIIQPFVGLVGTHPQFFRKDPTFIFEILVPTNNLPLGVLSRLATTLQEADFMPP